MPLEPHSSNKNADSAANDTWRDYVLITIAISIVVAVSLNATYKIFSNFPGIKSSGQFSAADGLSAASDSLAAVLGVAVALAGSLVAISLARQANRQAELSVSLERKIKEQNDFSIHERNFEQVCAILEGCRAALEQVGTAARALHTEVSRGGFDDIEVARSDLRDSLLNAATLLRQMYLNPILGEAWQVSSRRCRYANLVLLDAGNMIDEGSGEPNDTSKQCGMSEGTGERWEKVFGGASEGLREFSGSDIGKKSLNAFHSKRKQYFSHSRNGEFPSFDLRREGLGNLAPYARELEEYYCGSVRGFVLVTGFLSDGWLKAEDSDLANLTLHLGFAQPKNEVHLGNFYQVPSWNAEDKPGNELEYIWRSLADPLVNIDAFTAWAKMLDEASVSELQKKMRLFPLLNERVKGSNEEMDELFRRKIRKYYAALGVGAWAEEFKRVEDGVHYKMIADLGTLTLASLTLCLPRIDDIVGQSRNRANDGFNIHEDEIKRRAVAYILDTMSPEIRAGLEVRPRLLFRMVRENRRPERT